MILIRVMFMELFPKDSVQDLICRGISRDEICARTDVDVKTVRRVSRLDTRGIDRKSYQHLYIVTHVGVDGFRRILDAYNACKLDRTGFFVACGLGPNVHMPETYQTVKAICDCFGLQVDRRSVNSGLSLFPEGSVKDLICRSFSRSDIFDKTGVGSNGINRLVQTELLGVDRKAYQHLHIRDRVGVDAVRSALIDYGDGRIDKAGFFRACGIGVRAGQANVFQSIQAICVFLGLLDEYKAAYSKVRGSAIHQMNDTIRSVYGVDCAAHIPGVLDKQVATRREKYGYDYPLQCPVIKAKSAATMIKNHGHAYSMQCSDVRAKIEASMLARHGVRFTLESETLREKARATYKARTGYDHPFKNPAALEKSHATMTAEYGTTVPMHSDVIKNRVIRTNMSRYGVCWPSQSEQVKLAIADTNMQKYGVACFLKTPEFCEMSRATSLQKYGCEHPSQSPVVQAHIREGMRRSLGVDYSWQNPDVYAKFQESMLRTYGEAHSMHVPSIRDKVCDTKTKNGTWATSEPEEVLYGRLVSVFGKSDVVRQYSSDSRYKHHCDFYIRSRELFIELNGTWNHFSHWFGSWPSDDLVVTSWLEKGTSGYLDAVRTWTVSDVKKRADARDGGLNYIVFWAEDGRDMDLWFALGCPDGRDWEREYSWVSTKELKCEQELPAMLSVDDVTLRDIIRVAHWPEFYARELEYWRETFDLKWGTRQVRQYSRILRNFPDLPFDMITSQVILDSLNHSGVVLGYSEFHVSGLTAFLKKYRPVFLYDPCAGWGEPLVACAGLGVKCFGYSADDSVAGGCARIRAAYGLQKFDFLCSSEESGIFDFSGGDHDAVFAWLPNEVVSGMPEDVLVKWWRQVVSKSVGRNTRVFGYQVSDKIRDVLGEVLSAMGWNKDPHIPVRIQGVARPVEYVEVFVKP